MALAERLPQAVRGLFEGRLVSRMTCFEAPDEAASVSTATFTKLGCHIDQTTAFLIEGLRKGLVGELDKTSPSLGRQARYRVQSEIAQLPPYLTVQFVRFFWREDIKKKVKIVKPVQFPMTLDVIDLCEPELKKKLAAIREKDREIEDMNAGLIPKPKEVPMQVETSSKGTQANETGMYELCGIVTHQGMYAEGGHYVAWTKEAADRWIKFDDDHVTAVPEAEIAKLDGKGGGDWHIAYILLYKSKKRPTLD
jgi:ubiquitin carboxyl-terminal hydrolase 14